MYYTPSYHNRQRRGANYLLPFVSIIVIGLIVVLVFLLFDYFNQRHQQTIENKAAVKVITGRAEMKIWPIDEWTIAPDGSILREGDGLRTAPGSRIIMSLLNGSLIRLDSDTEVELAGLKTNDGQDDVSLTLKRGQVWVRKTPSDIVRASFMVATPHLNVQSLGTTFNVAYRGRESVDVIEGAVKVDLAVEDTAESSGMRTAETFTVAFGQEVSIGAEELSAAKNRRPIDVLALISDELRDSDWYRWNRSEDTSGATGLSVAQAVAQSSSTAVILPSPQPSTEEKPPQKITTIAPPVIVSPKETVVRGGSVTIQGTADQATQKMEVTTTRGGVSDVYMLKLYKAGSTVWTYVASRQYKNLAVGENTFSFVAIAKDGTRSEPASITITYIKPQDADLSAPKVVTMGGAPVLTPGVYDTDGTDVIVTGTIGAGIEKMVVNDFTLTRFTPGSRLWSYAARSYYGNLKDGENQYTVYGIDSDGNKTAAANFTINKKSAPSPSATQSATPEPKDDSTIPKPDAPL